MADSRKKHKVAEKKILLRVFKSSRVKNLMELEAKLSYNVETKALDVLTYLTVFEGFIRKDETKIINLQFSLPALIEMALEMEELTKKDVSESPFKHYTQSSTSKWVTLGKKDEIFFINFERKDIDPKKIVMGFGRTEFLAVGHILMRAVDSIYEAYDVSFREAQKLKKR